MKLFILSLLVALAVANVRYDGYQTLRIEPKDDVQHRYIQHLAETLDEKYDFWTKHRQHTDVMMAPNLVEGFKYLLDSHSIDYHVMVEDVQALIDSQMDVQPSATFDYSKYHTYAEIQDWVSSMASTSPFATKFKIATSSEGRDINGIKISTGNSGRKVAYFQGGLHAREWITPATVMYITNQLLANYGFNSEVTQILNNFDLYIVPCINPDGYIYTWNGDRMWRKTRSNNAGSVCMGKDPNRNYGYKWNEGSGSSGNKCSDTYRGESAHSEPEVADSTDFLLDLKSSGEDIVCFLDFHSYSQLWLSPWSYSRFAGAAPDETHHLGAAQQACNALEAVHGTSYTYGPSAETLYAADGVSVDWGYGTLGAKYSYVLELRDKGRYGFLLPENQIIPSGEETLEGVKALLQYIMSNE